MRRSSGKSELFRADYEGAFDFGTHARWIAEKGGDGVETIHDQIDNLAQGYGINLSDIKMDGGLDKFALGTRPQEAVLYNSNMRQQFNLNIGRKFRAQKGREWRKIEKNDGARIKGWLKYLYEGDLVALEKIIKTADADVGDLSKIKILPQNAKGADRNFAAMEVKTANGNTYLFVAISGEWPKQFPVTKNPPAQWRRTEVHGVSALKRRDASGSITIIESPDVPLKDQVAIRAIYDGPPNAAVPSKPGAGRFDASRPQSGGGGNQRTVQDNMRLADTERKQAYAFETVVQNGEIEGSKIEKVTWYSTQPVCDSCVASIGSVGLKVPPTATMTVIEGKARGPNHTPLTAPMSVQPNLGHANPVNRARREAGVVPGDVVEGSAADKASPEVRTKPPLTEREALRRGLWAPQSQRPEAPQPSAQRRRLEPELER
jgi:hypothetical protein